MPRAVSVIFVHGIYARDIEYATPMRELLVRSLPRALRPYAHFKTVFWADIVRNRSQSYYQQAQSSTGMVDTLYRRLVVEGLGDAAAYQKTRRRENSAYYQIQARVTSALRDADAVEDPDRPLVFVGHSLGCHIISSYAWDINRLKQMTDAELADWDDTVVTDFVTELRAATPFRRLDTFCGFVTLGNNMPLFTFMFGPDKVYPITRSPDRARHPAFPGTRISGPVLACARWLNFYSPNDLWGFPLKPLNSSYGQEERLRDHEVYSEGFIRSRILPSSLNAFKAHTSYWTNSVVVRNTSKLLAGIMTADDKSG